MTSAGVCLYLDVRRDPFVLDDPTFILGPDRIRIGAERDVDDFPGGVLEQAVEIGRRTDLPSIDGEQGLTRLCVHARLGERRALLRVPVQAPNTFL